MAPDSAGVASTPTSEYRDIALLARSLVLDLLQGRWAEVTRLFDTSMKRALSEDGLITAWSEVQENAGNLLSSELKSQWLSGGLNVVEIRVRFESRNLIVRLSLDNASRLAGLYFLPGT